MTGLARTLTAPLPEAARERLRLLLARARERRLRRGSARLGLVLVPPRALRSAAE